MICPSILWADESGMSSLPPSLPPPLLIQIVLTYFRSSPFLLPSLPPSLSLRTRLYFTSESHLHSLLNVMRFPPENDEEGKEGGREGGLSSCFTEEARRVIENTPELCYLTHVVLRMFEDLDKHEDDPTRFRIEILFSPGKDFSPFFSNLFLFLFH